MKKRLIILSLVSILLGSCEDFLTPRDKSQVLEGTLFTNREGVEDALYGIYSSLASGDLYGVSIPEYMDVLAQFYKSNQTTGTFSYMIAYDHDHDATRAVYGSIWSGMYKVISDINNFLEKLDAWDGEKLTLMDVYRGEALGLRAYLHFDLLRMFAPVQSDQRGIPYVTRFGVSVTPFSSVEKCYDLIIGDLLEAEKLLKEDETNLTLPRVRTHDFIVKKNRELHFNLYAVKATLARVYWTRNQPGDLEKAGQYAKEIIDSEKFPLVDKLEVQYMVAGVVAGTEGIWGLSNTNLYTSLKGIYCSNGLSALRPYDNCRELYSTGSGQDYRIEWFNIPRVTDQVITDVCCLKLLDPEQLGVTSEAPSGLAGVNQIRVAEMYLIAAEANLENHPDLAFGYLDDLAKSRGLNGFAPGESELTLEDIDREWRKELVQEGQVWFLMKHRQYPTVQNVNNQVITMTGEMWQLLIPDDEFEFRDESTF